MGRKADGRHVLSLMAGKWGLPSGAGHQKSPLPHFPGFRRICHLACPCSSMLSELNTLVFRVSIQESDIGLRETEKKGEEEMGGQ